jgi:ATPase subunit of ABC transporter with duplicated ATPase domains
MNANPASLTALRIRRAARIPTEATTDDVLTAHHLWWRYPRAEWLIRDMSLRLQPGSLLQIEGHNGAGKSTLLRILAGCLAPHRGTVRVATRVAYLPQHLDGLPPIPASRLLNLLTARGVRRSELFDDRRGGTPADRLSGGTTRRLVLDALLSLPTRVLVLDEPAAGLDEDACQQLCDAIRTRLAGGAAVVVAGHDRLPLQADHHLLLGQTRTDSLRSKARVVLKGRGSLRGEQSCNGVLTLHVRVDEVDKLLLEALRDGWSVQTVQRFR